MGTYMDHVEYAYIERLQEDIDIAVRYFFKIDLLTPVIHLCSQIILTICLRETLKQIFLGGLPFLPGSHLGRNFGSYCNDFALVALKLTRVSIKNILFTPEYPETGIYYGRRECLSF